MATVLTEGRYPGEFLLSEAHFHRSRDAVIIAAEQTITPGTLLARLATVADVTATSAADAGNTGDGTLTMADPAVSSTVKDGVYTVVCVEPGTNVGTFRVEDPAGRFIGTATVGVAFDGEVKFTIADGATDFAAGDTFRITVVADAGDFAWVAHDPAGTDGSQIPAAVALYGVTTAAATTASIAAITRDAEINGACLEWAAGITDAQKADATQALAAVGIIVR